MVMNLLITQEICTWIWSNREGRGTTSEALRARRSNQETDY